MKCPRCFGTDISAVGDTHYVCNNPGCVDDNGRRTQFMVVPDEYIRFPFNQIFIGRKAQEFYREPYLELS